MLDIEWFRQRVRQSTYEVSSHADDERQNEQISMSDLEATVLTGEIIEDYAGRKDIRGHACLISGKGEAGDPIHVVVAITAKQKMRFCTVYRPKDDRFREARFRRPRV